MANAATLAALLEAGTDKPGNVSPGKSFADLTYADFFEAALHNRWYAQTAAERGREIAEGRLKPKNAQIGRLIHDSFSPVRKTNVNFGVVLMGMPLAAAAGYDEGHLKKSLSLFISSMTPQDTIWIYKAMRKCDLGGMELRDKRLADLDVFCDDSFKTIEREKLRPVDVFGKCADYDRLASEWSTGYAICFKLAKKIALTPESIRACFLETLAEYPDTFIARKLGMDEAKKTSQMAKWVLSGNLGADELDNYLRSNGNKLSPGTTADIIATALFIKLLGA